MRLLLISFNVIYFRETLETFKMRINCEVQINDRQVASMNMTQRRGVRSSLAIGKHPGSQGKSPEVFIHLCDAKNKQGNKYKVLKFYFKNF